MGTETPKHGAPSKASPVISGWRQSIWFLRISTSRAAAEKILRRFHRPAAGSIKLINRGIILDFADALIGGVTQIAVAGPARAVPAVAVLCDDAFQSKRAGVFESSAPSPCTSSESCLAPTAPSSRSVSRCRRTESSVFVRSCPSKYKRSKANRTDSVEARLPPRPPSKRCRAPKSESGPAH